MVNKPANIVRTLEGQAPWGVRLGVGSFLTMEFGRPASDTPTSRTPHGEWHLWLYNCNWRVESSKRAVAGSEDDRPVIEKMLRKRTWGSVESIRLDRVAPDLAIRFSSGLKLITFAASSDRNEEQWMLFMPDGKCLSAYGDGTYEYVKQSEPRPRAKQTD